MAVRMDDYAEVEDLLDDQQAKIFDLFAGGAEVGPMGLVKGGPRGPENDVVNTEEFIHGTEGVVQEGELVVADETWASEEKPYDPKVGDRVRALRINGFQKGQSPYEGVVGVITSIVHNGGDLGETYYDLRLDAAPEGHAYTNAWAVEVEPVVDEKPAEREPKVGDRVRALKMWVNSPGNVACVGKIGTVKVVRRTGPDDAITRVYVDFGDHNQFFVTEWEFVDDDIEACAMAPYAGTTDPDELDEQFEAAIDDTED
jgi:hypothetical protein